MKNIEELLFKFSKVILFDLDLLSYMFDRKSSKKPIKHAKKFIKLTINTPELRDEAYIQIIKQIKLHKKKENCLRGWNLFAIVASCYEPSEKLFYSILNLFKFNKLI